MPCDFTKIYHMIEKNTTLTKKSHAWDHSKNYEICHMIILKIVASDEENATVAFAHTYNHGINQLTIIEKIAMFSQKIQKNQLIT